MKAVRLVKESKVYQLGRVLESAIPLYDARNFNMYTLRTGPPVGPNQLRGNEETVSAELGQVGTQFDALPHIGIADALDNCTKTDAVATRTGFDLRVDSRRDVPRAVSGRGSRRRPRRRGTPRQGTSTSASRRTGRTARSRRR